MPTIKPRAVFPGVLAGVESLFPAERLYLWDCDGYVYELEEKDDSLTACRRARIPELEGIGTMISAGACTFIGETVISERTFSENNGFVARTVTTGALLWEYQCQPEYVGPACSCGLVKIVERGGTGLGLHLVDPLSGVILDSRIIEDPYGDSDIWLWEGRSQHHVIVDLCDADNGDDHRYWEWECQPEIRGRIDLRPVPFYDIPTRHKHLPYPIDDSAWMTDMGLPPSGHAPTYRPYGQVGEWIIYWADLDEDQTYTLVFSLADVPRWQS